MSISSSDIKYFRSMNVSDAPSNGGLMSDVEVSSGASGGMFPNAGVVERTNGATTYRKLFVKCENIDNLTLIASRVWQDTNTDGMDRVTFFAASQRGVQADITGVERLFGVGLLSSGVLAGMSSINVEVEDGATILYKNGDLIRISDKATPDGLGNETWCRVSGVPSISGNVVTITTDIPLPVGYLSGAKVSSVFEAGNINASLVGPSLTSVGGVLADDWGTYLTCHAIGAIEQNWTLTFTSTSAFDISGDTVGAVGSGNVSGATPSHPGKSKPYFTLYPGLLRGTFAVGDILTFTTHPASLPLFMKRVIPSGTVPVSGNGVNLYVDGETE